MNTKTISYIIAALLLLAIFPFPYGYYTFLRLTVFSGGIFFAHQSYRLEQFGWAIGMVIVAVLFNPLIPIYLSRETWLPIDLICAGIFFVAGQHIKNKTPHHHGKNDI